MFTWNNVAQTFQTHTTDINKYSNPSIDLTAHVAYDGYSDAGSLDFKVILDIDCSLTTFSTLTVSDMTFTLLGASDT